MIKASDLIKQQSKKNKRKLDTFDKIYKKIESKILQESSGNYYFTLYEIPKFIIGIPLYNVAEAGLYLSKQLTNNGFIVEIYETNKLLISWFPKK
jgi:hypothetical protein